MGVVMDLEPDYPQTIAAAPSRSEFVAFTEVLKIAVPGLKSEHAALAAQIERMLAKRGVRLVAERDYLAGRAALDHLAEVEQRVRYDQG